MHGEDKMIMQDGNEFQHQRSGALTFPTPNHLSILLKSWTQRGFFGKKKYDQRNKDKGNPAHVKHMFYSTHDYFQEIM